MITLACEILQRLVAFPTISNASNLGLIDYCRSWLTLHGIESRIVISEDGTKASLFAVVGPNVAGGVVLSGHVDVVPIEGQVWTNDPWQLSERRGCLYGRGTADMKGFVAVVLASVPRLAVASLSRPVHIALSYDEEVSCIGGRLLVEAMKSTVPTPSAVFVGEPTRNKIVNGHKSYTELLTRIRGHAVHSGRADLGASAIVAAARLINWIDEMDRKNCSYAAKSSSMFDPPYTTLHCGLVAGGTAAATVAASSWFTTDIRAMPSEKPEHYVDAFRTYAKEVVQCDLKIRHADSLIEVDVIADIPGLSPEIAGSAETLARQICSDPNAQTVSYGTEAGLFQQVGWSTVVLGPGDILQAHRADEYIEMSQLAEATAMINRLVDILCH